MALERPKGSSGIRLPTRRRRSSRGGALAGVCVALAGLACATPINLHKRPWYGVKTRHFEVLGCIDADDVAEVARDLEVFRSVVKWLTGQEIPDSPIPTRVYAFNTSVTYRPFSYRGVGGYFDPSERSNAIVFSKLGVRGVDPRTILQHEYVHFLLRNRGKYAYPPWYDEGFAEFLSTIRVDGDKVEVGGIAQDRVRYIRYFRWVPLERILAAKNLMGWSGRDGLMFYAQSWAFVHYLNFGREAGGNARSQLSRYFKRVADGTATDRAARSSFGADVDRLDEELESYVSRGQFNSLVVPVDQFELGGEFEATRLDPAEVALHLGRLSLRREKPEQARHYYTQAAALDPDDARARAGLGDVETALEQWDAADAHYQRALELGPDDALNQLDYAAHLAARARATGDEEERSRLASRSRVHYVRSWKRDDSIPETLAGYGATFLLEGQETAKGLNPLERAHWMLPSSVQIKIALARLYKEIGREQDARKLALTASAWSHSEEQGEELSKLLDELGVAHAAN